MRPVTVNYWPSFLGAYGRETYTIDFTEGMKIEDVAPAETRGRTDIIVYANSRSAALSELVRPGDFIDFAARPGGPEIAVLSALEQFVFYTAVGFLAGKLLGAIIGTPKGPVQRGDETSPTFAWSGASNTRTEGNPIPVVYGKYLVAPQIIDEFIVTKNLPFSSDLYVMLNLGEGPHYSVAGQTADTDVDVPLSSEDDTIPDAVIYVNDNNLKNFDGVKMHVRMGTNEQQPIKGFEFVSTQYDVGEPVLDQEFGTTPPTNQELAFATYNDNGATAQAIWDDKAFSFDFPASADAYDITIGFHRGLYSVNGSTGNLSTGFFRALVRYIELDDGGTPITTGGDHGDGYVYVLPEPALIAQSQSNLAYSLSGFFYDPQTFTTPTAGNCLLTDGTNDYAATSASPTVPSSWSTEPDAFTLEGWFKITALPATVTADKMLFEWSQLSGSNRKGFGLAVGYRNFDNGGPIGMNAVVPIAYTGNGGTGVGTFYEKQNIFGAPDHRITSTSSYYHIALTYRRAVGSANGLLTIYVNGQQAASRTLTLSGNIEGAASAFEFGRSAIFTNTLFGGGIRYTGARYDEVRLYSTELSAADIQFRYNGGQGVFGSSSSDLVAAWHFDNTSTTTTDDYAPSGNNDLTLNSGASTTTGGHVTNIGTNAQRGSRYRLYVLRWNLKSDSSLVVDEATFDVLTGKVDGSFSYPNTVNVGISIRATEQLNSSTPSFRVMDYGVLLPTWDGVSINSPTIAYQWSSNPAWCFLDVLTNARYGIGAGFSTLSTAQYRAGLARIKEWAEYCDETVYDGKGRQECVDGTYNDGNINPIYSVSYSASGDGGNGALHVTWRENAEPPAHWQIGHFIGFSGFPTPLDDADIDVDINELPGLEIYDRLLVGSPVAVWQLRLRYNTATYGDPWPGFNEIQGAAPGAGGTVEGMEHRFHFDAPMDTFRSPWDALITIAQSARAMPIKEGNVISVRFEHPRTPIGIVNMASIKPKSFKYDYGSTGLPNSYVVEFFDEDLSYERSTVVVNDPDANFAVEPLIRENYTMIGVTRRSQCVRDALFKLKVNRRMNRHGSYATGLEGLPYEVGDATYLSHDIVPWGKGGRIPNANSTTTSIELDRDVTLEAATTYYLRIRDNSAGQTENSDGAVSDTFALVEVTSSAGTYPLGTPITVVALPFTPEKDDPYTLFKDGEEFAAQILETKLSPSLERVIEFCKMDNSVHDADILGADIPSESLTFEGSTPDTLLVPPVEQMLTQEVAQLTSDGAWQSRVLVSWSDVTDLAKEYRIWARLGGTDGPFSMVGSTSGGSKTFQFHPAWSEPGTTIEVAVQPLSRSGSAYAVHRCATQRLTLYGASVAPQPPTDFYATLDGDFATYHWTPPENSRGLTYELRVGGGWILGQFIGTAPAGSTSFGPTRAWVGGGENWLGVSGANVLLRARDSRGMYSEAVSFDWNPVPDSTRLLDTTVTEQEFYADRAWEDEWTPGEHWYDDGDPDTPTHVGLEREELVDGRWVLKFSGSALTGMFQTDFGPGPTRNPLVVGEHAYIELFAEAYQEPPLLVDDWQLPADHWRGGRRTIEGPLSVLPGEPANCTISIEVSILDPLTGDATDWKPYRPGIFYMAAARYRVVVTRPNTDYQLNIVRFHSRVTETAPSLYERDDVSLMVQTRLF